MRVFVLDKNQRPLDSCHPARARRLLKAGRAAIWKAFPFVIILKDRVEEESVVHEHRLKIDPGSKVTGLAILEGSRVVFAAELVHRGFAITKRLADRKSIRRSRRNRKTRYRKCRFKRILPKGWLPPSLMSRIHNTSTWVRRLRKLCPITALSQELVRFDFSKVQNPEISGSEYQRGTLAGYEIREYMLEKWNRTCAYCSATDVRLEIEHIQPKAKNGSDRVSNLTLACHPCNQTKGQQDVRDFLSGKPDILERVLSQTKKPLADASAVNSTRIRLYQELCATGLPVETGTGGMTKFNRTQLGLPKTHHWDAASVGSSTPKALNIKGINPLLIKATGHGNRQMAQTDKHGFPRRNKDGKQVVRTRAKGFHGFQTGDIVRAIVPTGKNAGTHIGRVTVRAGRVFDLTTATSKLQSINWKYFHPIYRKDGYSYAFLSSNVQQSSD